MPTKRGRASRTEGNSETGHVGNLKWQAEQREAAKRYMWETCKGTETDRETDTHTREKPK